MAVAACQVNQTAFAQQVQLTSVSHGVGHDIFTYFIRSNYGKLLQMMFVDFYVEVACVAHNSAVLHNLHMRFGDYVLAAGYGYKDIAVFSSLLHRHNAEAVKYCFDTLNRINLGNDNVSAQALGTHSNALTAPAIACNNNGSACYGHIGGTHDAIPGGLAGTVTVIKQILAVSIINGNHRKCQMTCCSQSLQTMYAGGGFLATAHQVRNQVTTFAVQHINQIAAVINNQLRFALQSFAQIHIIFFVGAAMGCENSYAAVNQCCGNFVLSGKRVAAGNNNISACVLQYKCQISGFCFQVNGYDHVDALERLSFAVFIVQMVQQGHIFLCPRDTLMT